MMVDDAEESQLKGPIDLLAPYTTSHSHRRPLDGTTEPRTVKASLTDRRRFRGGGTREAPSLSSHPTVEMCHLPRIHQAPCSTTPSSERPTAPRTPEGVEHPAGNRTRDRWGSSSGYGASLGAPILAKYPICTPVVSCCS